jgi:DNA (cytosine-5)-methyltransferase 1
MKKYFIDLFAGCGGLSLGLEQAGFTPAFVNELNNDALDTYLFNRKEFSYLKKLKSNDIKEICSTPERIEDLKSGLRKHLSLKGRDVSLLVGGPPCQGYSGIGHRRSYGVHKEEIPSNYLYKSMAKLIRHLKPRVFIFENVKGLLHARWNPKGKKGEIWKDVLKTFQNLDGYFVDSGLLYAKDYGIPQNRPRVFIVGVRNDLGFKKDIFKPASGLLPTITNKHSYPHPTDLLGDLLDPKYKTNFKTEKYLRNPKTDIQYELRRNNHRNSYRRKGDSITEQEYSNHKPKIVKKYAYMISNNGKIPKHMKTKKFAQRVLPKKWANGPNMTTTSLPDDIIHYSQPRILTVREWARFQTFPDWYQFAGKRTTGGIRRAGNPHLGIWDREVPKYTQIGNAVAVLLAKQIGKNIKKIIS